MRSSTIVIDPRRLAGFLASIALLLVLLSVAGQLIRFIGGHPNALGFVPEFDVGLENNVPTYFSTIILAFAALLLWIIAYHKRNTGDSFSRHWTILGIIFLYLSLDEAASFHEQLTEPGRFLLGEGGAFAEGGRLRGIWIIAWAVPVMALVVLFAISYLKFFLHLSQQAKRHFALAGLLYIGGAVGFESLAGIHRAQHGNRNLTYNMITAVEEMLEMFGVIVFIYGLLSYMRQAVPDTRLHVGSRKEAQPLPHSLQGGPDHEGHAASRAAARRAQPVAAPRWGEASRVDDA